MLRLMEEISSLLNRDIYPLLANPAGSSINWGISQTPSVRVNELVQQLATHVPVKAYWLAGYDVEHSRLDVTDKAVSAKVSCDYTWRSCQTAQRWQQDGLEITAMSGWQLDLALTDEQKEATQTCYIHIVSKPPTKTLRCADVGGNSDIPMQMTEKLCTVSAARLLIQPYIYPLNHRG